MDVLNSDLFRLDLTMTGQDCNTQSVVSNDAGSVLTSTTKKEKQKMIRLC